MGSHIAEASLVRACVAAVAALVVAAALGSPVQAVSTEVSDTLVVTRADESVSNVDIALRMSEVTPFASPTTVVVSRDDEFADALASGVLQGNAPMLMVPSSGPVPPSVAERITELGVDRAILLGGDAALAPSVANELRDMGLSVERRAGQSRFETAIDIAEKDTPDADTVMLARAFPAQGSNDPTQAYADSIAAGGLAAAERFPILLTQTEQLTGATAAYLARSGAQRVLIMGGTAAIGETVADSVRGMGMAVERIAGPTRFGTAIEIANAREEAAGAELDRVTLVSGTPSPATFAQDGATGFDPWAAGFAAAAHSAILDAPIVLTAGDDLPQESADYVAETVGEFDGTNPLITCTFAGPACESTRQAANLPPAATITFSPGSGALAPGGTVEVTFDDYSGPATVAGSCLAEPLDDDVAAGQPVTATAADPLPDGACTVTTDVTLSNGAVQTDVATFNLPGTAPADARDPIDIAGEISTAGEFDEHPFTATAGDRVFLDVRADNTNPSVAYALVDPTGEVEVFGAPITSDRGSHQLERTGTYVLRIGSDNDETGAYALTLVFPPTSMFTTSLGSEVSGTIGTPAERHEYAFEATEGQRVFLDVRADNTNPSVAYALVDPTGEVEVFGAPITSDRGSHQLERTGTYVLRIGSDNDETGAYALTLLDAPTSMFTTSLGSEVSGTIGTPAERHEYAFEATEGQRVFLDVRADNTNPSVAYALVDPTGEVEVFGAPITSDRGSHQLERTGTYVLRIGSDNDEVGDYALTLLEAPVRQFTTSIGSQVSGTIETPAERHDYTFSATAGDMVGIDVASGNTNPSVAYALVDPTGEVQVFGAPITNDRGPHTLEQSGTYTLRIGSDNDETGAYAFTFGPPT